MGTKDELLAIRFAQARAAAVEQLWREMAAHGLHRHEGWTIVESMRETGGGSELILRPMHLRRVAPAGLECVVHIHEESATIDSRCESPVKGTLGPGTFGT